MIGLDLSVRKGGLNIGRVYSGSGKIRVECISGSGNTRADVFRFYGFWINTTGLERLFSGLFFFCQNQNLGIFIDEDYPYLMNKHSNCNFLKEHKKHLNFSI